MIYNDIKNFNKQFEYKPEVQNPEILKKLLKRVSGFVVAGVGGSHLGADLSKSLRPELDVTVWINYGLPPMSPGVLKKKLFVASSYSGNTEEAIDAFFEAKRRGLPLAVVAAGGKLIALAKKYKVPYVEMPTRGEWHRTNGDMQPRMAVGVSLRALLKLIGDKEMLHETDKLTRSLKPASLESAGKKLARKLKGRVPVIYASLRNFSLAYIWKIKFNENGKIPAFCNFLSEVNHNEMTGFDVKTKTRALVGKFHFLLLKDSEDDPRIQKRMRILEKLYRDRNLPTEVLNLNGKNRLHKIFSSIVLADWASYYTAKMYGVEPEQISMIEGFKKLML